MSQFWGTATIDPSQSTALPDQLSSFVGRERELAELEALLPEARLITLTGPGGSGKTRLALELGATVRDRPSGGARFIDLSSINDSDLVVSSIAAALGVVAEARRPLLDTLIDRLATQHLLLILDNLEQLPAAASVVAELLAACPDLRVLATSRSPLRLRGERLYGVDPLKLPEPTDLESPERLGRTEAVALFVQRARAVDAHFVLTIENGAAVAEICRRLDGLPLAIELAAARSRILVPDALLRRLESRPSILTDGPVDAPVRQRTLRDAIAWSFDLLEPTERNVFVRLSVFSGGFGLDAAQAVIPDPGDPLRELEGTIGRLVDQNLVRVAPDADGEPRYGTLETIREFARDQLGDAEADSVQAAHGAFFLALAQMARREIGGRANASWLSRATDDLDNIRAALEWARDRGDHDVLVQLATAANRLFIERGDHREGGRWLRAAEVVASDVEPVLRAALLYELGEYEIEYVGDRARVEQLLTDSLLIFESLGDKAGMARAFLYLAHVAADFGDAATALARLERARSVARTVSDRLQAARLMGELATSVPTVLGRAELTLAWEAIALGVEVGDQPTIAIGYEAVGLTALAADDNDAAIAALSQAVRIWDELGNQRRHAHAIACLGTAHLRHGDIEAARPLLRSACVGAKDAQLWVGIWALEGGADWLGATGRAEDATVCWSAVDSARLRSLDRTFPMAPDFFKPSRERDASALGLAGYEAARASGEAMSLVDALDYAVRALERAATDGSDGRVSAPARLGHDLTPREHEVLELLAAGQSDGEIAAALFIGKKTASVHVANIKGKLGARSRVEIVRIALRSGLVDAGP
jgi:predicted ATPase/DNA-binding CsgD family transcriptional regulator